MHCTFVDSTDLTKAIKVTGDTYEEIGNLYGDQVSVDGISALLFKNFIFTTVPVLCNYLK